MEPFPKLTMENEQEVYRILRRISELREEDILAQDAMEQLNSYSSGFRRTTVSTSSAYSVGQDDLAVAGTGGAGGITLTLDADPFDGQTHEFWKADSGAGAVTISGNGKNINGSGTLALSSQYAWARVIYLGGEGKWLAQT